MVKAGENSGRQEETKIKCSNYKSKKGVSSGEKKGGVLAVCKKTKEIKRVGIRTHYKNLDSFNIMVNS